MDMIDLLIAREGGDKVVTDSRDPGGVTKFGISQRAYPTLDIRNLTYEQAYAIYKRDYLEGPKISLLPQPLQTSVFDFAAHSGVGVAISTLQRIVGTKQDGKIGPLTLEALSVHKSDDINKAYNKLRILFLARQVQQNPSKLYALGGWLNRVLSLF
jgi:lysozyme family protein